MRTTGPMDKATAYGAVDSRFESWVVRFFSIFLFHKSVIHRNSMASEYTFKYLMIGDPNVGKTSIVSTFINQIFEADYQPTIGVDYSTYDITIKDTLVHLQIWDTAGQERYQSLSKSYYHKSVGALLVFSLDSHTSFANLQKWIDDTHTYSKDIVKILLVGNKSDLVTSREVGKNEIDEFIREQQIDYIETSALLNSNVSEAFYNITASILQDTQTSCLKIDENLLERSSSKSCC